ncbi:MAG: hypothetical protein C4536_05400 [Actinobacteria bacterium]|nr:MAG: hypothetical protein C4536_05400 [Actinomycetota bacterium]
MMDHRKAEEDLVKMQASDEEARTAAAWCLAQDRDKLPEIVAVLEEIGHGESAGGLGEND